ncbi:hypothetical protein SAMN05421636_11181 [Pricia antarctica]|uniref:Uncharacterized protein n=1 Tax=Pricia antarctica TaxID=641691 RepID=A0A1G7IB69_9FLAO|nr:hypothetical protein SAMN05421636_11181 [Pricia antarctica]
MGLVKEVYEFIGFEKTNYSNYLFLLLVPALIAFHKLMVFAAVRTSSVGKRNK